MGVSVENGAGRLSVGGVTSVISQRIVRPANSTQYAAGDVVGSTTQTVPIEFQNCARFPGGTGIIQTGIIIQNNFASTKIQVDLLLFENQNITVAADNSAFAPTDLQLELLQSSLSFDGVANAKSGATTNGYIPLTGLTLPFQCADGQTSLWGVLVVRNAYTPASRETFKIKLGILQD